MRAKVTFSWGFHTWMDLPLNYFFSVSPYSAHRWKSEVFFSLSVSQTLLTGMSVLNVQSAEAISTGLTAECG